MEKGEGHHYRGKCLDEINISVDEAISDEENQSDKEEQQLSDKEDTEEQQSFYNDDVEKVEHQTSQRPKEKLHDPKHQKPSKLKKKVNIIPWTNKEKTTAITFFKKNIDLKKVPNKKEYEDLLNSLHLYF